MLKGFQRNKDKTNRQTNKETNKQTNKQAVANLFGCMNGLEISSFFRTLSQATVGMVGTRPKRKVKKSSLDQDYTQNCKMPWKTMAEQRKRAKINAMKKKSRDNITEKSINEATSSKKKTLAKKKKKTSDKTGKK